MRITIPAFSSRISHFIHVFPWFLPYFCDVPKERPVPAAYFRAFWPRFALVGEDVGGCTAVVEQLVVLRSAVRARPAPKTVALKAAKHFAHKAPTWGPGGEKHPEISGKNRRSAGSM